MPLYWLKNGWVNALAANADVAVKHKNETFLLIFISSWSRSTHLEKLDPVRLSEIARVLLVRSIVPMLMYAKAAASDAIAFRVVESLRRRIMSQSGFAQIVVGILNIHEIRPFRGQKIEADRIDRH